MKKIFTLFAAIIFSLNGFSQAPNWLWQKSIGDTSSCSGISIAVDVLGNVYTAGYFYGAVDFDPGPGAFTVVSLGTNDVFISKVDDAGNFLWAKSFGGTFIDQPWSMALDASGNIFITGKVFSVLVDFDPGADTFNLTGGRCFISKLDSAGNLIWAKRFDAHECYAMAVDTSGSCDVYVTGSFSGIVDFDPNAGVSNLTALGGYDIFISKFDSAANFVWAKRMGSTSTSFESGRSIAVDPSGSGNIYTTGIFFETVDFDPDTGVFNLYAVGSEDIFISKFDASGNFIWAKAFGGLYQAIVYSIACDPAGSGAVYTSGYFSGTTDFDPGIGVFNLISGGPNNIFISKLDATGNFVWAAGFGSASGGIGRSIRVDASGNVFSTGTCTGITDFDPEAGVFNLTGKGIFISKLSASGNFVWAKFVAAPGAGSTQGESIAFGSFGNVHVTGSFSSHYAYFDSDTLINIDSSNSSNMFIAKLDTLVTGISEKENSHSSTTLSPNPFHETATLTINTNKIQEGTIEIKNILGAAVQQPKHFTGNTIKLQRNNLPAGIYFYRITTKEGMSMNGKFIID